MQDLFHYVGGDLSVSSIGGVQPVIETTKGQQRILRRLLTNPARYDADGNILSTADYIWHPDYGAGLPWYIGQNIDIPKIKAVIREQILLEEVVAKSPEPVITLIEIPNGLSCTIQYNDALSNTTQTLSFDVTK